MGKFWCDHLSLLGVIITFFDYYVMTHVVLISTLLKVEDLLGLYEFLSFKLNFAFCQKMFLLT